MKPTTEGPATIFSLGCFLNTLSWLGIMAIAAFFVYKLVEEDFVKKA